MIILRCVLLRTCMYIYYYEREIRKIKTIFFYVRLICRIRNNKGRNFNLFSNPNRFTYVNIAYFIVAKSNNTDNGKFMITL